MPRPLRIEFPGALYHITSRGDRRERIYPGKFMNYTRPRLPLESTGAFAQSAVITDTPLLHKNSCEFTLLRDHRVDS